jgi:hypothetical protein
MELAVFLKKDFYLAFRLFQLLAACGGELHSLFEQRKGFLQRDFSLFQLSDNFLQSLEALFKFRQWLRPVDYCNSTHSNGFF